MQPRNSKDIPARGETIPVQGEKQERSPREPHERDESVGSQAAQEASGQRMGSIAHDDLREGQVDTDKGAALDSTYDKLREGEPKVFRK